MGTQDLSSLPTLTFSDVERYAKDSSGCENTAKAYKFFAEPGFLHDIKCELIITLTMYKKGMLVGEGTLIRENMV